MTARNPGFNDFNRHHGRAAEHHEDGEDDSLSRRHSNKGFIVHRENQEARGVFSGAVALFPMRPDAPGKRAGRSCPRCAGSVLGVSCLQCGWEDVPTPLPLPELLEGARNGPDGNAYGPGGKRTRKARV